MAKLIDKDALVAEIDRILGSLTDAAFDSMIGRNLQKVKDFIDTLDVKEVDLGKLGEIARHLIAVKNHIEDMRLDNNEWLLLEKIGYPEQFRAKQG